MSSGTAFGYGKQLEEIFDKYGESATTEIINLNKGLVSKVTGMDKESL
jgi:hypothetical protein